MTRYLQAMGLICFLALIYDGYETRAAAGSVKKPFVNFTSQLDNVDVFIGTGKASATFIWTYFVQLSEYRDKFSGFFISFGKIDENAIDCKGKRFTSYEPVVVKNFRHRRVSITKVDKKNRLRTTKDLRAEFTFKDLGFSDTGRYYCRLTVRSLTPFFAMSKVSEVNLRILDLEINKFSSSDVVEAWKDHQITLRCVANVADGVTPVFEWRGEADNSTITGRAKQSNTARSTTLTLNPRFTNEFSNYTCIAKTARTTAEHTVIVRKLYEPQPPRDLQHIKMFATKNKVYPKVSWKAPNDGGSPILKYIVEFKPVDIPWARATRVDVNDTAYLMKQIRPGKAYDVRVFAISKVNSSKPSKSTQVTLDVPRTGARSHASTGGPRFFTWLVIVSLYQLVSSRVVEISE